MKESECFYFIQRSDFIIPLRSSQPEHDISVTLANFHLDSKMNLLDFGGQKSTKHVTVITEERIGWWRHINTRQ